MAIYIGPTTKELENGKSYHLQTQDMSGKIYKPGKHIVNGKHEWIDKVGAPDLRIMVWTFGFYKVYQDTNEISKDWKFDSLHAQSPRTQAAFKS